MRAAIRCSALGFAAVVGFFHHLCAWQQTTAGFNNARTSYDAEIDLPLPLALGEEVPLEDVTNAWRLLAFEGYFLVGEAGTDVSYHLHDRVTGNRLWTWSSGVERQDLPYVPAYAEGRVLLSGTVNGVAAVRVSDGSEIWRDESVGATACRFPVLTGDLALYHGEAGVVAAQAETGEEIWRLDIPSAPAPLSLSGTRLHFLGQDLRLRAVNALEGSVVWESEAVPGGCRCSIVAAQGLIFVTSGGNSITAFDAATGAAQWQAPAFPIARPLSALLAQGRLIAGGGDEARARFTAVVPDSGELIYERDEAVIEVPIIPPAFLSIFNLLAAGETFLYNNIGVAIQFRSLKTGELVWSIDTSVAPARDLSVSSAELDVLLRDRVRVYRSSFERFVPHFAVGQGQGTEIVIANDSPGPVSGRLEFYNSEGTMIPIALEGLNQADPPGFSLPSRSALRVNATASETLQSGWIRLLADGPLAVSSLFRAESQPGQSSFEAGIADAKPLSQATIGVLRQGALNTAVAIANPLGSPVDVGLTLRGSGLEAESQIRLSGHAHLARFIHELFPEEAGDSFDGALVLEADRPIVVTALRTLNGLQVSSLPVGRQ